MKRTKDVLDVRGGLAEPDLAPLARYARCTIVRLHGVAGPDLAFLERLPLLEDLQLYDCRVADWAALTRVKTLRRLFVNGGRPTPLDVVAELPELRVLSLANLPTLERLPDLSRCASLRDVRIWSCKRLHDMSALLQAPAIEDLSLVSTPHVPDDLAPLLALPHLQVFAATFGSKRANEAFAALLARHGKRATRAVDS